jgi:hypothetical protein
MPMVIGAGLGIFRLYTFRMIMSLLFVGGIKRFSVFRDA